MKPYTLEEVAYWEQYAEAQPVDHRERLRATVIALEEVRAELEYERMRLTACGVAAMTNTPDSIAEHRLSADHRYSSASYQDVCKAVDREIKERNRAERAEAECAQLRGPPYLRPQ